MVKSLASIVAGQNTAITPKVTEKRRIQDEVFFIGRLLLSF